MADNFLVGKWTVAGAGGETQVIQFYKDGSCLVPVTLLGNDSETFPLYYFYQAFENHTIKFESGEPVPAIYLYEVNGNQLSLKTLTGHEYLFVRGDKKYHAPKVKNAPVVAAVAAAAAPVAATVSAAKADVAAAVAAAEPADNEWKCPKCGKIHKKYVGTCGCGEPKPVAAGPYIPPREILEKLKSDSLQTPVIMAPDDDIDIIEDVDIEREPKENEWKCPKCGKIHLKYVGTCGCGEPKPASAGPYIPPKEAMVKPKVVIEPAPVEEAPAEAAPVVNIPEVDPADNEWQCPKCGKTHKKYVGTCGCGEPKPVSAGPYIPPREILEKLKSDSLQTPVIMAPDDEISFEEEKVPEREPQADEWKCPGCGKIHKNYVGTCGCGISRS